METMDALVVVIILFCADIRTISDIIAYSFDSS